MWIVDQLEEGIVCLECTKTKELMYIDQSELPRGAAPGDAVKLVGGKWQVDKRETDERAVRISKLFAMVKNRYTINGHKLP